MDGHPARTPCRPSARLAAGVAVVAVALGLRGQLLAIGPLIPDLEADLHLDNTAAGLVSSVPLLAVAVCTLAAPRAVARFGSRRAMTASLAVLLVASLLRAGAPTFVALLAFTVVIGLASGLGGAIMPVFIKEAFPTDAAFGTGIYSTALQLGSTAAVGLAVPLALLAGGWRGSLAMLAVLGGLTALGWVAGARASPPERRHRSEATPIPWRSPMAWWLTLIFWLTAVPYFALTTWLAAAYVQLGWSALDAGTLVAVVGLAGLPGTFGFAWLADRVGSRRGFLIASAGAYLVAAVGLILAPGLAWVFAALAGFTMGGQFTLALTLPLDVSRDPAEVAAMVALVFAAGYLLVAATPVGLGIVADLTHDVVATIWVTVLAEAVVAAICWPLTSTRLTAWREAPTRVAA